MQEPPTNSDVILISSLAVTQSCFLAASYNKNRKSMREGGRGEMAFVMTAIYRPKGKSNHERRANANRLTKELVKAGFKTEDLRIEAVKHGAPKISR